MAKLSGTTPERFLVNSKRYEQTLINKGYLFIKEGKGKKASYTITRRKEDLTWEDMDIKQRLEYIFDFKVAYPIIIKKYIAYIYNNINDIKYMTDMEVALAMGYAKSSDYIIRKCRNQLIQAEFMQPLNKYDCNYYLLRYINNNRIKTNISKEDYSKYWKEYFYEDIKLQKLDYFMNGESTHNIECFRIPNSVMKKINYKAFKNMSCQAGGYVCKSMGRVLNENFFNLAESLLYDVLYIKEDKEDQDEILNNLYSKL